MSVGSELEHPTDNLCELCDKPHGDPTLGYADFCTLELGHDGACVPKHSTREML